MLMSIFKILVNNLFYKNFDIYFIKKKVKILITFLFFHKFFFFKLLINILKAQLSMT